MDDFLTVNAYKQFLKGCSMGHIKDTERQLIAKVRTDGKATYNMDAFSPMYRYVFTVDDLLK